MIKKILKHPSFLLILALFIIGAFLRLYRLPANPPSLNWDEVSHGYNAFSLLKTGRDEWGKPFPLIFRAFGDYKLPLYIYLTTISVALLGLNALSVRLVSALAGSLAIPGIYLLLRQLFPHARLKIKKLSLPLPLLAAFFLTFNPWHFFISRPALEANLALTLLIFAAWALLKARQNSNYYLLSSLLFSLSLHTYNTARVFVPLLLLDWLIIYRPRFKLDPTHLLSALLLAASLGLVAYQVISGVGTARYSKLAILSPATVHQIGQRRLQSDLPFWLARLRFNRPVYFTQKFLQNYFGYFSLPFFYQVKGVQEQFAIPVKNLLTLPVLLFALIGFIHSLLKSIRSSISGYRFTLLWLFLAPIAAALTADPPQALRPNPLIPALIILAVFGLVWLINLFTAYPWAQKLLLPGLLLIILFAFYRYHYTYWQQYRYQYASAWQYGYQEAVDYLEEHQGKYDKIFFSKKYGEPHIFYAFYTKLDPRRLWPDNPNNIRFYQSDWYWTDKIGSVYFVNAWDIPFYKPAKELTLESGSSLSTQNSLLITTPSSVPSNTHVLKTIHYPQSQNVAFAILEFN